jgi:hypothetical protein
MSSVDELLAFAAIACFLKKKEQTPQIVEERVVEP